MLNVKGYGKLTEEQKDIFDRTYQKHIASLGAYMKGKHAEEHIERVIWDKEENCLKVYYDFGDWYHYRNGRWY